jgi:hypothetical protein
MAVFGKVSFEPLNLTRNELTYCLVMHKNTACLAVSEIYNRPSHT